MSERYAPSVPASQIEYRCLLCGFRGVLSQQAEHRATHKAEHKPKP